MAKRIVIDKSENRLYLYEDGRLLKRYRVATGKDPYITPEGTFSVVFKTRYPEWTNPQGRRIPGGSSRNPLGSRWLGLGVGNTRGRVYGIHGTNPCKCHRSDPKKGRKKAEAPRQGPRFRS